MQYRYTLLQKPEFMVDFLIDLMQFRVFIRHSQRDRYNNFKEVMDTVTFLIRDPLLTNGESCTQISLTNYIIYRMQSFVWTYLHTVWKNYYSTTTFDAPSSKCCCVCHMWVKIVIGKQSNKVMQIIWLQAEYLKSSQDCSEST